MKQIIPHSPILVLFCLLCTALFAPSMAAAVSVSARQWDITADKMTRVENPPSLIAEGNVILEKKEPVNPEAAAAKPRPQPGEAEPPDQAADLKTVTTIRADRVTYDINQGILEVKGKVVIDIGPDRLTADSGRLDLNKSTGSFQQATVVHHQMDTHFEGEVIEKTGDVTYHIKNGWVVTCKLEPGQTPPWSFAASDADITDGGYAFLTHTTFRIKDVPVLYSPVMILPAKRQRQTGLLFPTFGMSDRDGFSLETPLFVNLSESTDLTLYPRYLSERGMMYGAEYRYAWDNDSKGMLMGNYLDDQLSDPSETSYYQEGQFTHTNQERYWVRGKADHNIGSWTTRLDIDVASDLDYLREFDSGSTGFTTSQERFSKLFGRGFIDKSNQYRENSLAALRSWDNGTSLLAEALAINDLSEQAYSADNPSRAWELPSLTYSGVRPLSATDGPAFSWDANYTDFWRDKGVGAQRVDLVPTITTGIPLTPYLETTIGGGVRDTAYMIQDNGASDWQDTDSRNRFLYNLGGEVSTTLMADYAVTLGDMTSLSHAVRPFVAYGYTDIPDGKMVPQFDPIDDLEEQNTFYYGVNNFFNISGERNGRDFEREYAFFKVKQGYDLRSEESDTPLTPVDVETGFYPLERLRLAYNTEIDVYGDGAYLHSLEADYYSTQGEYLTLDYRYNQVTDINSVRGTLWYLLPYNFAAGYSLERALEQSETIEEKIKLRFIQPCWSVEMSTNATPGDRTFLLTFRLAGIGNALGFDLPGL